MEILPKLIFNEWQIQRNAWNHVYQIISDKLLGIYKQSFNFCFFFYITWNRCNKPCFILMRKIERNFLNEEKMTEANMPK